MCVDISVVVQGSVVVDAVAGSEGVRVVVAVLSPGSVAVIEGVERTIVKEPVDTTVGVS